MASILSLQEIDRIQNVEAKIREELYLKGNIAEYFFDDIKGKSAAIKETKRIADSFAKLDSIVLILGETGTGKELFAQSIHNASLRSHGPFVAVNCGAIPSNLIESELFGYSEGAFTGAKKGGKRGLFEIAHRGTIFLDEISEMDIYGQVMLLRVIQEKQIRRIGDDRVIPVDVRIIAATNKNLIKLVEEKKFREDLYYRLNVLTLKIPPLRDRQNDIEYLMQYFIDEYNKKFYKYVTLTEAAIAQVMDYPWYGNVRHLKSFCERLVALANQNQIGVELIKRQLENELLSSHLSNEVNQQPPIGSGAATVPNRVINGDDYPAQIIELLRRFDGNKSKVAEHLGISRTTLWRQIKQYHIKSDYSKASG
jgi:transcriptional regulator with PAS, ATPase and Fis domain